MQWDIFGGHPVHTRMFDVKVHISTSTSLLKATIPCQHTPPSSQFLYGSYINPTIILLASNSYLVSESGPGTVVFDRCVQKRYMIKGQLNSGNMRLTTNKPVGRTRRLSKGGPQARTTEKGSTCQVKYLAKWSEKLFYPN